MALSTVFRLNALKKLRQMILEEASSRRYFPRDESVSNFFRSFV